MTAAQVAAEAQAITGQALSLPAGCAEVDTEFKCNRCQEVSLTSMLLGTAGHARWRGATCIEWAPNAHGAWGQQVPAAP